MPRAVAPLSVVGYIDGMDKQDIIDLIAAFKSLEWEVTKATESPGPGWQPFAEGSYGIILWRRIKEVK